MSQILPRYPIYVPSKGRYENCLTAKFFIRDGTPFYLVVEEQEANEYARRYGKDKILVLPFSNMGSVIPARNWIKEHATQNGFERHWQFDDNIQKLKRRWKGRRIPCNSGPALACIEDFVDRYENIGVAGLNYEMFLPNGQKIPVFYVNVHVYSACLILSSMPYKWRGRYNEDTDLCLQVLSGGQCTVLFNVFEVEKMWTMQMKGGNTDALYHGDGRLKMARSLERMWPGVVETKRRFQRPQHVIKDSWRKFDTPLKLKPGIDLSKIESKDYGIKLKQINPIKSKELQALVKDHIDT